MKVAMCLTIQPLCQGLAGIESIITVLYYGIELSIVSVLFDVTVDVL